jgi:hypothetical protein
MSRPMSPLAVRVAPWLLLAACAPKWQAAALVDERAVARALHDPAHLGPAFDPKTVPDFAPPEKVRPCCAFGQDLRAEVGPVPVPLYRNKNIRGPEDVGPHGYDKGELTREHNGLVYTCRGGFIDIAHVRDNADRTLWLALEIARALPGGVALDLPEEGTARRVVVAPLPDGLLAQHGRWPVAAALASWADHQLGTWHEVVTWYGWQSTPGFSERLSAFSPEDIYSNILGANLAAGIVVDLDMRSREQYDQAVQAWLHEALRRLGAVPEAQARAAMAAVDGRWWDSRRRLPEFELIPRRALDITSPVRPWIVADAVPDDSALRDMCARQPAPLALRVPERLGDVALADLVTVRFEFSSWIPERFPLPAAKGDVVTHADLPKILAAIREQGAKELGPHFDRPADP